MKTYSPTFYNNQQEGSLSSAKEIIPIVLSLVQAKSVLDVGCGVGTWLSVFKTLGITDYLGVDGNWVDKNMLHIPKDRFISSNLELPLYLGRQFDLVISLEVAEHLPQRCAEIFVESLVRHGQVILFAAAIPLQGGRNHVNEQWPDYWVKLFRKRNYVVIDCIRKHIWKNDKVAFFYAQNMFLFVKEEYLAENNLLNLEFKKTQDCILSIVHPQQYLLKATLRNGILGPVLALLQLLIPNSFKQKIKKMFFSQL